jgi:cyclopropane-fatty-acyl-phospholipid synthase
VSVVQQSFETRNAQEAGQADVSARSPSGSWLVKRFLAAIPRPDFGRLRIFAPDGAAFDLEGRAPGPEAAIVLNNRRAIRRILSGGDIGFAEAYIDDDLTSPNLVDVVRLVARNSSSIEASLNRSFAFRWIERLRHFARANTRRGSRANILAHYDLGNEFYRLWLDPSMTYSSAIWSPETPDLEAAQARKLSRIAELLDLKGGERVLEIGCGWGAMACRLAQSGAKVVGLTLSPSQLKWARKAAEENGFDRDVDLRLQDYRDVEGAFDRVVSIEMIEAVGLAWLPSYFSTLRRSLREGGRAVVQAITIAEERFEAYKRTPDFIQKHIFPGGFLPTKSVIAEQARRAGLRLVHAETFGKSYALTLAEWRQRFHAQWPEIAKLGFDARFRRLWTFYLCYCEAGFLEDAIDVGLYTLEPL